MMILPFLSTLSLRRATIATKYSWSGFSISIHALLAESDFACWYIKEMTANISIHALLAESDIITGGVGMTTLPFLSTLSLRRATGCISARNPEGFHFYPRSPCGERRKEVNMADFDKIFLSTLSLRRATYRLPLFAHLLFQFLSTLSLRRATLCWCWGCPPRYHFYPRSPCGERHGRINDISRLMKISIHALLAESDPSQHFC